MKLLMRVKDALKTMEDIDSVVEAAISFRASHPTSAPFIDDMVGYLGDYKKVLKHLSDNAEIKL